MIGRRKKSDKGPFVCLQYKGIGRHGLTRVHLRRGFIFKTRHKAITDQTATILRQKSNREKGSLS